MLVTVLKGAIPMASLSTRHCSTPPGLCSLTHRGKNSCPHTWSYDCTLRLGAVYRNTVFVTDHLSIRLIHLRQRQVSTFPSHIWYRGGRLLSLALSPDKATMLIGVNAAIFYKNIDAGPSDPPKILTGEKMEHHHGKFDGDFDYAS